MTTHRKTLIGTSGLFALLVSAVALLFPAIPGKVQSVFAAQISAPATPADNGNAAFPDSIRGEVCQEEALSLVEHLAEKFDLDAPSVVLNPSTSHHVLSKAGALYDVETGTIHLATCVSMDVLVHEFGHHVMQERAGKSWPEHLKLAQEFCKGSTNCEGLWVDGEPYPGVEHAAHCIGNMIFVLDSSLGAPSDRTYTKCYGTDRTLLAAHILEDSTDHSGHDH